MSEVTRLDKLHEKALTAARKFLTIQHYAKIFDTEWVAECNGYRFDIIALIDDDTLAFIDVFVKQGGKGTNNEFVTKVKEKKRATVEAAAAEWLSLGKYSNDCTNIRFDEISIVVVSEDKAMLRHVQNYLAAATE